LRTVTVLLSSEIDVTGPNSTKAPESILYAVAPILSMESTEKLNSIAKGGAATLPVTFAQVPIPCVDLRFKFS